MKLSAGFSQRLPAILMGLFYAVSFYFLTLTLKKVELSVAYAIWSGVGTALIATIGILVFGEPMNLIKAFGLLAIVIGVVALNLTANAH